MEEALVFKVTGLGYLDGLKWLHKKFTEEYYTEEYISRHGDDKEKLIREWLGCVTTNAPVYAGDDGMDELIKIYSPHPITDVIENSISFMATFLFKRFKDEKLA